MKFNEGRGRTELLRRIYINLSQSATSFLGVNGFLIKQKHIAVRYVPCSAFRSKRLLNLDVEAENESRAWGCVKRPHLAGVKLHTAAGRGCEAKKWEEAPSAWGGSHSCHPLS